VLADGDEFVSGGQRYEIGYTATAVNVTWLGAVPVTPVPTPAPAADPTLADTGVTPGTGIAAAAGVLALVGGLLLVRRRRVAAGL
jgi:LPXTG-motif cell wall-anchored protein